MHYYALRLYSGESENEESGYSKIAATLPAIAFYIGDFGLGLQRQCWFAAAYLWGFLHMAYEPAEI